MTDQSSTRRMRIMERLREAEDGLTLSELAGEFGTDERTIRRDAEYLQALLSVVGGIEITRGRLRPDRSLAWRREARSDAARCAMAEAALGHIPDGTALVVTAGRSTLAVASAIRRSEMRGCSPKELIVFTNSLPALLELVEAGISTGIIGEVYNPRDMAFHSHELRTRFQASIAVVGASGIVLGGGTGSVSLCSDRVEEAAFMRQILAPIPQVLVVADATKIGRRHPWSFTSDGLLTDKSIHIVTTELTRAQTDALAATADAGRKVGLMLSFEEVQICAE